MLSDQISFLLEIDKLKTIVRQSHLANGSRRENSAEHSWHLAMFAIVLGEHADPHVDALHAARLLLIHDIVEIDAGDAPIHSGGRPVAEIEVDERRAAERIFGLLPEEQSGIFRAMWHEFEEGQTPEARFAKALDRLQPLLLNISTGGGTWTENGVTESQVIERYGPAIAGGSAALWDAARRLVHTHFVENNGSTN